MYCNKCGCLLPDNANFCPKCGETVVSNENEFTSEFETDNSQLDEYPKSELTSEKGEKGLKSIVWISAIAIFIIAAAIGGWMYWDNKLKQEANDRALALEQARLDSFAAEKERIAGIMAAPEIKVNEKGFFSIEDCPTTHEGLGIKFTFSYDETYKIVESIEIIRDEDVVLFIHNYNTEESKICLYRESDEDVPIHYLDANFDGYIDVYIGHVGQDSGGSELVLWNPEKESFERVLIDYEGSSCPVCLDDVLFSPSSKSLYSTGYGYEGEPKVKKEWQGNKLVSKEELVEIMTRSSYEMYDVTNRYTLREVNDGKVICSTDNPSQLPGEWQKIAWTPDEEEEAQFAEEDRRAEEMKNIEWMYGTWRCDVGGGAYTMVTITSSEIRGHYFLPIRGEYSLGSSSYRIEGDRLISDKLQLRLDRENQRVLGNDGRPFYRSSSSSTQKSNNSYSQSNSTPRYILSKEKDVQDHIDELYLSIRSGQMGPNIIFLRQALPSEFDDLINYYSREGNYNKVRDYQYKKRVVMNAFREIGM